MDNKFDVKSPFRKYGHHCSLDDLPDEFDYNHIPRSGLYSKFRRLLVRLCVVSESSKMFTHHLRSFGSIVEERQRQVRNFDFRIHPFSKAYLLWSMVMIFVIFLKIISIALDFLYYSLKEPFVDSAAWIIVAFILDAIFVINLILRFYTGYYDEPNQVVVLDSKLIARRYLRTFFIIDALACFPTRAMDIVTVSHNVGVFIQLMNIFKYLLVIRLHKHIKYCAEILNVNYYKYMVTLVVILSLLYWHVGCCMIRFFREEVSSVNNEFFKRAKSSKMVGWREANQTNPTLIVTVGAFYRGSLIIYNSSYGKVLPGTVAEIVFLWFGWYASSLFFIYILAMIIEIMKGKTSAAHKYVEMERQLKDYMRHKQLPAVMRRRILTYYEFRFQKCYFREHEILDTISMQLRQEINMHACKKLVENVEFFKNLPLNLLVRIISSLRIEVYLVNDIIIKANTPGNSMYFISTGTMAIYTKSGKEICHLDDGAHFGEIALIIKGILRTASVVAVEVSEIYRLDQKDFVRAISPYPDLLANMQHIAAERMEVASMLDEYNKMEHNKMEHSKTEHSSKK